MTSLSHVLWRSGVGTSYFLPDVFLGMQKCKIASKTQILSRRWNCTPNSGPLGQFRYFDSHVQSSDHHICVRGFHWQRRNIQQLLPTIPGNDCQTTVKGNFVKQVGKWSNMKRECHSSTSSSQRDIEKHFELTEVACVQHVPLNVLLEEASSVQQVLDIIYPKLQRKSIVVKDIAASFRQLETLVIEEIKKNIPHCGDHYLSSSFVAEFVAKAKYEPIELIEQFKANKSFQLLKECARNEIENMSVSDMVDCMTSLKYFPTEEIDPLQVDLLMRLMQPGTEVTNVMELTRIMRCAPNNIIKTKWGNQQLQNLFEKGISSDETTVLALISNVIHSYLTVDFKMQILSWIHATVVDKQDVYSIKVYLLLLRLLAVREQFEVPMKSSPLCERILDESLVQILKHAKTMSAMDLGFVAICAVSLNIYNQPWAEAMHHRALELFLAEPGSLLEFIHVAHAMHRNVSALYSKKIEEIFSKKIDELDGYILPYICPILKMFSFNAVIHERIEKVVLERLDFYMAYNRFFQWKKVMKYVQKRQLDASYSMKVENYMQVNHLQSMKFVFGLSYFCGQPMVLSLDNFQNALELIPKTGNKDILELMSGMSVIKMTQQFSPYKMHQLNSILDAIKENILNMRWSDENVLHCFHLMSNFRDPRLISKLFPTLLLRLKNSIQNMSFQYFFVTCMSLRKLQCNDVTMIDNLTAYVLTTGLGLRILLDYLAVTGVQPRTEHFVELCRLFINQFESMDVASQVCCIHSFCLLQIFPENLIRLFFSLKNFEKLDNYMKENPEYLRCVVMVMEINRAVTLQCPHFNIPWLFRSFKKSDLMKRANNPRTKCLHLSMKKILEQILTSYKFGTIVLTPYCHILDFVCLIEEATNRVFPFTSENFEQAADFGLKRVSLQLLESQTHLCTDLTPNGLAKAHKRELEIMGYRHIQIRDVDWLAKNSHVEKTEFLCDLIFSAASE